MVGITAEEIRRKQAVAREIRLGRLLSENVDRISEINDNLVAAGAEHKQSLYIGSQPLWLVDYYKDRMGFVLSSSYKGCTDYYTLHW